MRFTFLKWPKHIKALILRRCYIQSPWQPSWHHPGQLFHTNRTRSLSERMEETHNCTSNGHWVGVTSQIRSKTRHRMSSSSTDTDTWSSLQQLRVRDPPVVLCSMFSPLSLSSHSLSSLKLSCQHSHEKSRHRLLLLYHFHC